jgi:hypothetical protein
MNRPSSKLGAPKVLAVCLGVLTVGAGAAGLLRGSVPQLPLEQAGAELAERFAMAQVTPLGLELSSAHQLGRHELYVTFRGASDEPEQELDPLPFEGKVASDKGSRGRRGRRKDGTERPKTEWEKLALRDKGPDPVEASFLFVEDKKKAEALLDSQFGRVKFKDFEDIPADGEVLPIDSGHLDWGDYEADWVHLRHYEKTDGKKSGRKKANKVPTSHDTLRVNLTTGPEARVLYLRWARAVPGDVAAAETWLAAFQPREPAE